MFHFSGQNDWAIYLAERTVLLNAERDLARYGKPFSHPFLALANAHGEIVHELHGIWDKSHRSYPLSKFITERAAQECSPLFPLMVSSALTPFYPCSRMVLIEGTKEFGIAIAKQILDRGPENHVREAWDEVTAQMVDQNMHKRPFYLYAQRGSGFVNCQVMLREAMEKAAVFAQIPDLQLAQTGWTQASEPAISSP